ncbi:MAG: hypothetical protein AAGG01_12365 [Planctomycetota bacterium]
MPRIAIVEDEPHIAEVLMDHLSTSIADASVEHFLRPRDFAAAEGPFSHVVVDLSFGWAAYDGPELGLEYETGLDAVAAVRAKWPTADVVIATILPDQLAIEVLRAIREWHGPVPALNKLERRLPQQLEQWIETGSITSNVDIDLVVGPVPPMELDDLLRGGVQSRPRLLRLIKAISQYQEAPSNEVLAEREQLAPVTVRKHLSAIAADLEERGVPRRDTQARQVWEWARPRRARFDEIELTDD